MPSWCASIEGGRREKRGTISYASQWYSFAVVRNEWQIYSDRKTHADGRLLRSARNCEAWDVASRRELARCAAFHWNSLRRKNSVTIVDSVTRFRYAASHALRIRWIHARSVKIFYSNIARNSRFFLHCLRAFIAQADSLFSERYVHAWRTRHVVLNGQKSYKILRRKFLKRGVRAGAMRQNNNF